MEVRFIGQGLDVNSEQFGEVLRQELSVELYSDFVCCVAFISEGGINRLRNEIIEFKNRGNDIKFFVGIHNRGTSKQALLELLNLEVETYIFYNARRNPIYHPKVYILKNTHQYNLFVGSNNFTADGLFRNVEGAVSIKGNLPTDVEVLNDVEEFFETFLNSTDVNIQLLTTDLIEYLSRENLIPNQDEYYRSEGSGATTLPSNSSSKSDEEESSSLFPRRPVPVIPSRIESGNDNGAEIVSEETEGQEGPEIVSEEAEGQEGPEIISEETEGQEGPEIVSEVTEGQEEPEIVSEEAEGQEGPEIISEEAGENEITTRRIIWYETRTLTSGSRNQLDFSSSGLNNTIGGIDLINPARTNHLNITVRYQNQDYFNNPIYYPDGGVRPNGSWRLSMRGRTVENNKFTDYTRHCQLCDSILVFHQIGENHYELEVLGSDQLDHLISISTFSSHGPNRGRYYGEI